MGSTSWLFFLSVPSYLLALFSFITSFVFRLRRGKKFDFGESVSEESNSQGTEAESENNCEEFNGSIGFADSENESSESCLKFRFPTYEEFINGKEKDELRELVDAEVLLTSSTCTKYEFMSEKGFSGFIDEPEVHNIINIDVVDSETKPVVSLENQSTVALDKNLEQCDSEEGRKEDEGVMLSWEKGELGKTKADFELCDEKESFVTDSDSVSIGFEHIHDGLISRLVDYYSDGFLSDHDFGGEFEFGSSQGEDSKKVEEEVHHSENLMAFNQVDTHVLEEHVGKLEQDHLHNLEILASQFLSENNFHEDEDEEESESESESESNNEGVLDWGESNNKLESLWEHQELIEQLQMELRKVRATGLPTIFEESPESSSKMEDLMPWKIDERFHCMGELHKFYKSYRERMRKFDILTYQKMYAIGFLQKDPLQLLSNHKSPRPTTLKSLLSQNLWLLKHRSHGADPMKKFIKDLQSDLEVVYVGQMCLSWEFLNWQYGKALNLWDSDPRGLHQYNEVAGEFQQFQVLMQRFIEDEPFQGTSRVQHYIKRRCDARNLLQVPVIREDSIKDRKKSRRYEKGDSAITIEMIVETLEESIRIFWHFVKGDKDSGMTTMKGQKGVHPDVQNAEDVELLMEVMKSLRKKENALKNILRSEQCILRRFRRCRDEDSDHVLYFFSQVDMKLVSRVLNMSSRLTTDQLVWCHDKLSRISFVQRKIRVDPSFLLFPC